MKRFHRFCANYAIHIPFPVTEPILCYFAAALASDELSPQTIKVYLSAVRDAHVALGFPDPRSQSSLCRLERIQAGIKRVAALRRKPGRVRLLITPAILHELRSFWMERHDGNGTLLWAIAAIYRFCANYAIHIPFPVTEPILCYFAAALASDELSPQTIKVYLSAVRDAHVALGFPDPRSQSSLCRLERIQAGIKRVAALRRKPGRVRLPITPAILHELRSFWMERHDGNGTLLWAIAAIC